MVRSPGSTCKHDAPRRAGRARAYSSRAPRSSPAPPRPASPRRPPRRQGGAEARGSICASVCQRSSCRPCFSRSSFSSLGASTATRYLTSPSCAQAGPPKSAAHSASAVRNMPRLFTGLFLACPQSATIRHGFCNHRYRNACPSCSLPWGSSGGRARACRRRPFHPPRRAWRRSRSPTRKSRPQYLLVSEGRQDGVATPWRPGRLPA